MIDTQNSEKNTTYILHGFSFLLVSSHEHKSTEMAHSNEADQFYPLNVPDVGTALPQVDHCVTLSVKDTETEP